MCEKVLMLLSDMEDDSSSNGIGTGEQISAVDFLFLGDRKIVWSVVDDGYEGW